MLLDFAGQLVEMRITQQIGLPSFSKSTPTTALGCRPNYPELLIKLLANGTFRNLSVWTKIGEKSYESTGAFLFRLLSK